MIEIRTFEHFIALAFPWLPPHSPAYQQMRAAWDAGFKAGQKEKDE